MTMSIRCMHRLKTLNNSVWHCYRCNKYADLTNPAQTSELNNYSHFVCISHVQTTPSVVHDRVFLSHPIGTSFSSFSFFWSGNTAVSIWNRSFMFCSFNLCFESSKYCKTWLRIKMSHDWGGKIMVIIWAMTGKTTTELTISQEINGVFWQHLLGSAHSGLDPYPYLESSNSYIINYI